MCDYFKVKIPKKLPDDPEWFAAPAPDDVIVWKLICKPPGDCPRTPYQNEKIPESWVLEAKQTGNGQFTRDGLLELGAGWIHCYASRPEILNPEPEEIFSIVKRHMRAVPATIPKGTPAVFGGSQDKRAAKLPFPCCTHPDASQETLCAKTVRLKMLDQFPVMHKRGVAARVLFKRESWYVTGRNCQMETSLGPTFIDFCLTKSAKLADVMDSREKWSGMFNIFEAAPGCPERLDKFYGDAFGFEDLDFWFDSADWEKPMCRDDFDSMFFDFSRSEKEARLRLRLGERGIQKEMRDPAMNELLAKRDS